MKLLTGGGTTITNRVVNLGINKTIPRVRKTLKRSHGTTRTKNHGIKIRSHTMAARSQTPKMLVSPLLKM